MKNKRQVVVLIDGGIFIPIKWEHIKKGDTIRLFEPDGTPVEDEFGNTEFTATSDAYLLNGYWQVESEGRI
jgi:hypothetical protein